MQKYINLQGVAWQLVEPDNHRVNATERAIQNFKNYFISDLFSVDEGFPLQLWCYLLVQAEITLNLLQMTLVVASKLAYKVLEGAFDHNSIPLAPAGTKVSIFKAIA